MKSLRRIFENSWMTFNPPTSIIIRPYICLELPSPVSFKFIPSWRHFSTSPSYTWSIIRTHMRVYNFLYFLLFIINYLYTEVKDRTCEFRTDLYILLKWNKKCRCKTHKKSRSTSKNGTRQCTFGGSYMSRKGLLSLFISVF